MKKILGVMGLMMVSQFAHAAGVTKLQIAAAKYINNSAAAKKANLNPIKPSQLKGLFLNGSHGVETGLVRTKLGAFPENVSVQVNNGKFSQVTVEQAATKPGQDF